MANPTQEQWELTKDMALKILWMPTEGFKTKHVRKVLGVSG